MKRETLKSIAEKTGVSVTTASRVLSDCADKYRISKKTQELVLNAARICGYHPSLVARSLRTNRSNAIGLVLPSVAEYFFASLASLIIQNNTDNGYTTMIVDTQNNPLKEKEIVNNLLSRNIDGLIIAPTGKITEVLELLDRELPVIQVDRHLASDALCSVCSNNYQIGREITEILIKNGHRKIACIQGTPGLSSNDERVCGYCDAMREVGLETLIYGNTFNSQESYFLTKELLDSKDRPEAIVSLANGQAIGILNAAQKLNLKIPGDLSLVTVDDNKYMDFISPSITRMAQPMEDLATACCKLLYDKLNGYSSGVSHIKLKPRLIPGNSVKNIL